MANSAKPCAWVTEHERGPNVEEKHLIVTTTRGDLANSHGAVYDALKKAGISPARSSVGSIRLTVADDFPLSEAKDLVVAILKTAGIKVNEL